MEAIDRQPSIEDVADTPGWRADLSLRFASRHGRTALVERKHVGPLLVQRPFHPEGAPCHTYIVHPPGGIVGGDQLSMNVVVDSGAHALLTTPAATKFYRSESRQARQALQIDATDAVVEWLPQETIFYRGSLAHCATHVQLHRSSRFIGWEIPCLGLPARGELFTAGHIKFDLELWVEGVPLLVDRLRLDGAGPARTAPWGLANHDAFGTLLAYPADVNVLNAVRSTPGLIGTASSTLVDRVLVCRAVAAQAEHIKNNFIRLWQMVRPLLLDRPAVSPRIWAT